MALSPRRCSVRLASTALSSTSLDTEVGTTFNYINNLTMVARPPHLQGRRRNPPHPAEQLRQHAHHAVDQLRLAHRLHQQRRGFRHLPPGRGRRRQPAHVCHGLCAGRFQSEPGTYPEPGPALRVLLGGARDSEPLGGGRHSGLRRLLPQGHALLRSQPEGLRAARRHGLGAARAPRQDHHSHRLRHLLRRQPERRLQRSGGKRRAALLLDQQRHSQPCLIR